MSVRIYGTTIGHGSFARVTEGMAHGLRALGECAGLVPVDDINDEASYVGHDADVAVLVGPPAAASLMTEMGEHSERLYMLPPNSTWVSENIIRSVWPHVTGFIAPSTWAQETLCYNIFKIMGLEKPVELWHHGADPAFAPEPWSFAMRKDSYERGQFTALHLASTTMSRKGTEILLASWDMLVEEDALGRNPMLHLCVDGKVDLPDGFRSYRNIAETQRMNLTVGAMATLYRSHHVVVQPSRGEGFGMVPLEASCCGVPIVATDCTGHRDHVNDCAGAMVVRSGPLAPIDDGPGAMAPALSVSEVSFALEQSYRGWLSLARASQRQAAERRAVWSWENVTRCWLESRGAT